MNPNLKFGLGQCHLITCSRLRPAVSSVTVPRSPPVPRHRHVQDSLMAQSRESER